MLNNLRTMLKSIIISLYGILVLALSMIPALTFHFTIMYVLGDDWSEHWNILVVLILFVTTGFVCKRNGIVHRTFIYLENL